MVGFGVLEAEARPNGSISLPVVRRSECRPLNVDSPADLNVDSPAPYLLVCCHTPCKNNNELNF